MKKEDDEMINLDDLKISNEMILDDYILNHSDDYSSEDVIELNDHKKIILIEIREDQWIKFFDEDMNVCLKLIDDEMIYIKSHSSI